jgi:thiol-disulfide isomerase/thioredoxin
MKRILIVFALLMVPALYAFSGCSKNVEEGQPETKTLASAAMESNSGQGNFVEAVSSTVYTIESVTKAASGKVPDFTWKEDGKTLSFSEITKGKVVFLNFWGTWCPPCRAELPSIVEISKELDGKDFIIIGIPVSERAADPVSHVANFASKNGINYRNIVDLKNELGSAFGNIRAVPTTFIIDKKGNISETLVGGRSKNDFMTSIKRAMGS